VDPVPDPFAIQADPRLYVPRRATEEVLDELERGLSTSPSGVLCFSGPPGIGKTLLLHVLAAERAAPNRSVYLAYPKLPPNGLWRCVARGLGLEAGSDARQLVRRLLSELGAEGGSLLLQVDDASLLPAEALDDLLTSARSEPRLQVVLAHSEEEPLTGPLSDDVPVVRLDQPMSRSESQAYVQARLAACRAPRALVELFDTVTVARLHRESEGNPLRLHGLAVPVARGVQASPQAPQFEGTGPAVARALDDRPEPALQGMAAPAESIGVPFHGSSVPSRRRRRARRARVAWLTVGFCLGLGSGLVGVRSPAWWYALRERGAPTTALSPGDSRMVSPEPTPAAPTPTPSPEPMRPAVQPTSPPSEVAASPPAGEAPARPAAEATSAASARPDGGDGPSLAPSEPTPVEAPAVAAPPAPEPAEGIAAAAGDEAEPGAPSEPARSERAIEPRRPARATARESAAAPAPPAPLAAGRLHIDAEEPVLIEIDGRPYGTTPLTGIRLSRGPHRVIARYGEGGTALKTVHLGDTDVSVSFR
jgi:type II secretory pathway predicted ATPase ExeA